MTIKERGGEVTEMTNEAAGHPAPSRAVLFDFGGVLAEEGFRAGLYEIATRQGFDPIRLHQLAMDAVYDSGYVVGRGSEADFWNLLRQRAGLQGEVAHLSGVILRNFTLRPAMLETVRRLRRQGYLVAILSDQTDWLERLDARYHFYREFDRVFNSYRLGKGKRDPSLFDDVVTLLGVTPEEALFVDDLAENVARAESRGLQGLLFRDEADFTERLAALPGLGSGEQKSATR